MVDISESLGAAIEAADLIVVGTGFFGLTVAERAASDSGATVLMLDRRGEIGGNAFSYREPETGIEVHKYGSHLFHTSNAHVWEYVRRFTEFNEYRHTVYTIHRNKVYSLPINLGTICEFLGRSVSPGEAQHWVRSESQGLDPGIATNFEDRAIALIGRPLYEAFIRGYTEKQWQTDPRGLPAGVISRLPVRYTFNNRYFNDRWEGLPLNGYSAWFERMIDSPLIDVRTGVDFFDIRDLIPTSTPIVYTGPLDEFFDYRAGTLTWRTLDFDITVLGVEDFQGTSVMNYADTDVTYTRIHEFKHLHPEREPVVGKTVIMKEFSRFAHQRDEPYYPVNSESDRRVLRQYREMAAATPNVIFGGRLGSYQYLDMHMAIASALSTYERDILPVLRQRRS